MEDHLLKDLWLNANQERAIQINAEKLIESVNRKALDMEIKIKQRDRREIGVALLVMIACGWLLFYMSQVLAKVGAAITFINGILIIVRINRARKVTIPQEATSAIKYQIMVSLQRVRQQIKLLNTVFWWYLLPFFVAVLCFCYAIAHSFTSKVFYTVVETAIYGYIWHLNKEALRKEFKPLENSLVQALKELSE